MRNSISLLALALFMPSWAAVQRTANGVTAEIDTLTVGIEFYTPSSVRIVKTPASKARTGARKSVSVIAEPEKMKVKTEITSSTASVSSSEIKATLNLATGEIQFSTAAGTPLLSEGKTAFEPFSDAGNATFHASQSFVLDPDEVTYGLGNHEDGRLSRRGFVRRLEPGNLEDGIPVMQSSKGYGIIWDATSAVDFSDSGDTMTFTSVVGNEIDYYFMYGRNADGVIAQIRTLTGKVPMFPLWTYGYWQSRERYKSQDEIMGVVANYRKLGVPLDGIIQDWQYWGNNYLWNAMEFMSEEFTNPGMMIDSIHAMNAHPIISIWSSFGPMTKPYRELDEKGLLFNFQTWPESGISHIWPPRKDYPSGVRVYDCYSPEARDIYWNNLRRIYDLDMDGWWMDSTEPDHVNFKESDLDTPTAMGTYRSVKGAFPIMTVGGVHDHQRATSDDKRIFILTRSGWTGQQRYGCNVWTGDVASTWDMLRKSVPAMLNFSMTGNPNTNTDIGGFFCGAYNSRQGKAHDNPLYRELYTRWLQMGAFSPMMRSHGTDAPREIWYFGKEGEPVYDAIASAIRLRYSLLPYIYSTSHRVSAGDYSFMRPLVMDFPADRRGLDCNDQYMFGGSILVAPVLNAHYTPEKTMKIDEMSGWNKSESEGTADIAAIDFTAPGSEKVYLPAGTDWYDFETNERHKGGAEIEKTVTLATIPLYVRAGSVLPIGPEVQYTGEKPWDDLEIRVYPGADGEFVLYEDEGDNYNYEKGAFTEIPFRWNDRSRTLTVGVRKGTYDGMLTDRRFRVRDMSRPDAATVEVNYTGKAKKIKL